jgi:hypothetical protein
MSLEIINKMSEEDAYLFKRTIRKLLNSTFIVADKDEKLYDFIAMESNQYDVNDYLSLIGYQVMVDERMKVAMLQQNDNDIETVGLKRANLYRFDASQIKLLLVLWMLYLERMGYEEAVYVSVGDIIDKCGIYQINLVPSEFKNAYQIFKRFSLIDFDDSISREDGIVRLYPSLQFCMDIGQLKKVIEEYTGAQNSAAGESSIENSEEYETGDLYAESEEEEYE